MATEQQKATAKEYFASSPSESVLHISTDGQVFFQKNYNDGASHQRRIDPSQKMTTISRKDLESKKESPSDDEVPTDKWTNAKIAEWLTAKGCETSGKETKAVLLELAASALAASDGNGQDHTGEDADQDDDNSDENE